jgi:NAD(P)-dependent dehydrogenase (short-subunit alcohol dehydrogenase family)
MAQALVTGAARRLGRAMALDLAARGFDVAVHYAGSEAEAAQVVAEITAMGRRAKALRADLTDERQSRTLVAQAVEALGGPLTVLVNNASIFENDGFGTLSRDSWDRHLESNLRAPVVLTEAFAAQVPDPVLDANGEPVAQGLVVNMIDQRVLAPGADFISYTLAKSALWTFTRTAAQALAPRVRVCAIGPGPTLQGPHQTPQDYATERAGTLLHRGASPGEICATLGFFLSMPALTGQMICVDGGQHLGEAKARHNT